MLVAGERVDALVAQRLKAATNSEFLFLTPSGVIASTLNPRATIAVVADLARKSGSQKVSDGVVEYARFETPLIDIMAGRWARSVFCAPSRERSSGSRASTPTSSCCGSAP